MTKRKRAKGQSVFVRFCRNIMIIFSKTLSLEYYKLSLYQIIQHFNLLTMSVPDEG